MYRLDTELEAYAETVKCTWRAVLPAGQIHLPQPNQLQRCEEGRSDT